MRSAGKKIEFGSLIGIVSEQLKVVSRNLNLGNDYIVICALALEILEKSLQEECFFPIDISNVVGKLGIDVFYQPLNSTDENIRVHKMVGRIEKRLNIVTNEKTSAILIDRDSNIEQQRYALAHELAHYLIHHEDLFFKSEYHIMPMLFTKMEEMVADIFAIFLLIPIPAFLEEFLLYIKENDVPVQTSKWLEYLGRVTAVPYEDVAIGYQNIRYVCGMIYEIKHGQRAYPETGDKKVDEILRRQVDKIISYMTDEVEAKLFC